MNGIQEVLMSRSWTSVVDFGDDITGMPEEFVVIILSGLKSIAMLEEGAAVVYVDGHGRLCRGRDGPFQRLASFSSIPMLCTHLSGVCPFLAF